MTDERPIDVPRAIRCAAAIVALLAAGGVYAGEEPLVSAANARLDRLRAIVRSEDLLLADGERSRRACDAYARRYASSLARDPDVAFLRDIDRETARHGVGLVGATTMDAPPAPDDERAATPAFARHDLTIELRGSYLRLLDAIADASRGRELLVVRSVSFRRDARSVIATVPITIYDPRSLVAGAADREAR